MAGHPVPAGHGRACRRAPCGVAARQRRWVAALAILLLAGVGAFGGGLRGRWPARRSSSVLVESRSLAVMPFTDLSEPPAPHLALAVDTGLSTDLGRLADVRVTPRGSVAALGSSASVDLKRIARELGVRHVVTGTVRRDGERLRSRRSWCAPTTVRCSGPTASNTPRRRTGWRGATSRRASPTCSTCGCAIRPAAGRRRGAEQRGGRPLGARRLHHAD